MRPQIEPRELERAWQVFQRHQDVCADVLSRFRLDMERSTRFAHDFATSHLPVALRTFDEAKGRMPAWLYTVFLRYVERELAEESRRCARLHDVADLQLAAKAEPFDAEAMMDRILQVLPGMDPEHRECIRFLFEPGSKASLRAFAASRGWSRHRAEREMFAAVVALVASIEEQALLTPDEIAIWRLRYREGLGWEDISRAMERAVVEVLSLHKSMWDRVRSLFTRA